MRTAFISFLFSFGILSFHCPVRSGSGRVSDQLRVMSAASQVSMEEEILGLVNEHRKSMGLQGFKADENESRIAAKHSQNMASGKVGFGHSGFNARAKSIQKTNASVTAVAENVAEGQMTARQVVDGWLNSPGHRKNIEGNYMLTGIGYAPDKKGNLYFTQIFTR